MPGRASCSVDGCDQPAKARGWCKTHWARWRKHGDPDYQPPVYPACVVLGCANVPRSKHAELCEMHYGRLRRTGSTDDPVATDRFTERRGYVLLKRPDHPMAGRNGWLYEHRLVAAEKLGRMLEPDEYVHHVDGNVANNEPDNLEVVSCAEHNVIHGLLNRGHDPRTVVPYVRHHVAIDPHARAR